MLLIDVKRLFGAKLYLFFSFCTLALLLNFLKAFSERILQKILPRELYIVRIQDKVAMCG